MDNDLFKDFYYKELERKEIVYNRLQWTLSIWVVLFGAILFCFNNFKDVEELKVYFWTSLILSILSLSVAAIFIGISLWGRKILYLPKPSQLDSHYKVLQDNYNGYVGYENQAEIEFSKYMNNLYIKCADSNIKRTDKKVHFSNLSVIAMIISVVFLVLSFSIGAKKLFDTDEPIQKVQIMNSQVKPENEVYLILIREE